MISPERILLVETRLLYRLRWREQAVHCRLTPVESYSGPNAALPDEYEWVWTLELINIGLGICGLAYNEALDSFPPALHLSHTLTFQDSGLLFLFPRLPHLPEQRCVDSRPEIEFVSRLFGERAQRFHSEQLQYSNTAHKQASVFASGWQTH